MTVYVDIDGTLTKEQRAKSAFRSALREDVIAKVKAFIAAGHDVILWSGSKHYAKRVAKLLGIKAIACLAKPDVIVENQPGRWARRFKARMMLPEAFAVVELKASEDRK